MKKQVFILLLVLFAGTSSFAQCDKKSVLTSRLTEYLSSTGEILRTVEESTTVEFDSKTIVITPGEQVMEGTITSISCDWKTAYKEGKTVIKSTITMGDGQLMDVSITIEGKDGQVTLLFEESPENRIRITLEKFEEKK